MIRLARPVSALFLLAEATFGPSASAQPADATTPPQAVSVPPGQEIVGRDAAGNIITCVKVPGTDATPDTPALPAGQFRMAANPGGFLAFSTDKFGTLQRTGPSVVTAAIAKGIFQDQKAFVTFPTSATVSVQTALRTQIGSLETTCEALEAAFPSPLPQPPVETGEKARLHRETQKFFGNLGKLGIKGLGEKADTAQWGPYALTRTRADRSRYQTLVSTNIGNVPTDILFRDPVAPPPVTVRHAKPKPRGAHS